MGGYGGRRPSYQLQQRSGSRESHEHLQQKLRTKGVPTMRVENQIRGKSPQATRTQWRGATLITPGKRALTGQKWRARIRSGPLAHVGLPARHGVALGPGSLLQKTHYQAALEDLQASSGKSIHSWGKHTTRNIVRGVGMA
jgi:hypothetical protein